MTHNPNRLLTEIQEQPQCLRQMLEAFPANFDHINFPGLFVQKLIGIGEGSSFNALKIAAPYIEELTGLNNFTFDPESLDNKFEIAQTVHHPIKRLFQRSFFLSVSQSGETGSILKILSQIQRELGFSDHHAPMMSFTNNREGTLGARYGNHFELRSGEERSIAATKSMTSSILALLLFGLRLGQKRSWLNKPLYEEMLETLLHIPASLEQYLQDPDTHKQAEAFARSLCDTNQFVLLSKGALSTILPEVGLKLTETSSNIVWTDNMESFKHGRKVILQGVKGVRPNCLYLVPPNLSEAVATQFFQDVHAHFFTGPSQTFSSEGVFFAVFENSPPIPEDLKRELGVTRSEILTLPASEGIGSLFLAIVAFQLLSYYLALAKGEDPNNPALQKAVTR